MAFSVTLDKQLSLTDDPKFVTTPVRLTMVVTSVTDFNDQGIFTYVINQTTGEEEYSHVATPNDIRDFNFDIAGDKEFVRKNSIDLAFETGELATEAITEIEARIQQLIDDEAALGDLGSATTVTITET